MWKTIRKYFRRYQGAHAANFGPAVKWPTPYSALREIWRDDDDQDGDES